MPLTDISKYGGEPCNVRCPSYGVLSGVSVAVLLCFFRNPLGLMTNPTMTMTITDRSPNVRGERILALNGSLGPLDRVGLCNQYGNLLGLVWNARRMGIRYLAQRTLTFTASWTDGNTQVAVEQVIDVAAWNKAARQHASLSVPLIVDVDKDAVTDRIDNLDSIWIPGRLLHANASDPLTCWFWSAVRPEERVMKAVRALRQRIGSHGALHARIEQDLLAIGGDAFWQARVPLSKLYPMVANYSHSCIGHSKSLFMAVGAEDVKEKDDKLILGRGISPWPNVSLYMGGSNVAREAGLEGSRIQGALIDFQIVRDADFFIGPPVLSSFTRSALTARRCAFQTCSFSYGPDGITHCSLSASSRTMSIDIRHGACKMFGQF
jgi:hypothetical protein